MPSGSLEVFVAEARNLKDKDTLGKMDPYINLRVERQNVKTKVASSGGRNPAWNETKNFEILEGTDQIYVEVMDKDTFSADDLIGAGVVPLKEAFEKGVLDTWVKVINQKNGKQTGEVHVRFTFTPKGNPVANQQRQTQSQQPYVVVNQPAVPVMQQPMMQPVMQQPMYAAYPMPGMPMQPQGYPMPGMPMQQGYPMQPQGYPMPGMPMQPQGYPMPQQGYPMPQQGYPMPQGYSQPGYPGYPPRPY